MLNLLKLMLKWNNQVASIRVVDNGTGIEQDDLGLVFHRHATSKIDADDDLFHIRTLDFVAKL